MKPIIDKWGGCKYLPNNIYNVDAYEAIKEIPDKSIDLIVTDPPYLIETQGGNTNIGQSLKNGMCKELEAADICDGIDYKLLDEFVRIMKKINIYIWCNKKQVLDYLSYFKKYNCSFEIMVWCKPNPTPLCGGNYLIDKEFCLYFRKGIKLNTTFETAKTFWVENVNIKDKKDYLHPTIKPLQIIELLVNNSSNESEVVFDCFLGSGTTAIAAKELGRQYLGFEINKKFYDIAIDRVNGLTQQDRKLKDAGIMNIFDFMEE